MVHMISIFAYKSPHVLYYYMWYWKHYSVLALIRLTDLRHLLHVTVTLTGFGNKTLPARVTVTCNRSRYLPLKKITTLYVYYLELLIWVFTNISGRMRCIVQYSDEMKCTTIRSKCKIQAPWEKTHQWNGMRSVRWDVEMFSVGWNALGEMRCGWWDERFLVG